MAPQWAPEAPQTSGHVSSKALRPHYLPAHPRPPILHGYGGAKRDIPRALPTIAQEGWVPLAHSMAGSMAGYRDLTPSWCGCDLRPVVGTSCDFKFGPGPLTEREQLLLLSLWRRGRVACLPNATALRTWLDKKVDIPFGHGPDHSESPHSLIREVASEPLFQIERMQIATSGETMEITKEETLAIRVLACALSREHLELLNGLLLGGSLPFNFPHDLWKHSVQDYLDGKQLMEIPSSQAYVDILRILPFGRHRLLLIDKLGNSNSPLTDRAVTSLRYDNGEGSSYQWTSMLFMKLLWTDVYLKRFALTALAWVAMTLEGCFLGTFAFVLTGMDSPSMDPPLLSWKQLSMTVGGGQNIQWHSVLPRLCMNFLCCIILLLIVPTVPV